MDSVWIVHINGKKSNPITSQINWIDVMPQVSEEHKIKVRQTILEAAMKTFAKTGYSQTRMDDVAKAAGVSKGTPYLYFPTKEDLFFAICKDNQKNLIITREGLFAKRQNLATDLGIFYDVLVGKTQQTERIWLEGLAESARNPRLKQTIIKYREELVVLITEFLKQIRKDTGFFKDQNDLVLIAKGMIALYNGLTLMRVVGKNDETLRSVWIKTMKSIFEGSEN
ncbi:MAG TPA: TetR/AcrR family transcriptional regulator [Nitrosopumilaceae archaeon]|nr:TetR/AcrR family transcriptional regulator [Nitrosopumilaceae archaeon]